MSENVVRDWQADQPRMAEFLKSRLPYPAVFATLSGADLYGFPSGDGDYDLRAAHVLPTSKLILAMLREGGMDTTPDLTVEAMVAEPTPEMDFVSHDIAKFLRLALRSNGYVLEQLLSPLVVLTTEWHQELKALAPGLITRRVYHHYRGFFSNQEKLYKKEGVKRAKGLLYQYRVPLTGIHALETGEIEANLQKLNTRFRLASINELIAIKMAGEKIELADDARYVAEIASFDPLLTEAFEKSSLPDEVPHATRNALQDFLLRCRKTLGPF